MGIVETVFAPIVAVMGGLLHFFYSLSENYGTSIILLSVAVNILAAPLIAYGRKIERKEKGLQDNMAPQLAAAKSAYKGEALFNETEKIYKAHGYHPLHSIRSATSITLQLPFLIASLLLLLDYAPLKDVPFLFITDLSRPDQIISGINLLPLMMFLISLAETAIKPDMDTVARRRFVIISAGITLIVYNMPAAVVLYWTTSNLISFARSTCAATQK